MICKYKEMDTQVTVPRTRMAIVKEAYNPPRIVMPEKEEIFFVNLRYPTSTEMATLCTMYSVNLKSVYT